MKIVNQIIKEVRNKGDLAILKYNIKFDKNNNKKFQITNNKSNKPTNK